MKMTKMKIDRRKLQIVLVIMAAAFLGSRGYAMSKTRTPTGYQAYSDQTGLAVGGSATQAGPGTPSVGGGATGGCGGGCCGSGGGPSATKAATVEGGVQKLTVDLSKGYYDPDTIELKAGVPAEITFGQASGCLAQISIPAFNVFEDLTAGPKIVKLPVLQPGEYQFSCGMQMVFGKIVVK